MVLSIATDPIFDIAPVICCCEFLSSQYHSVFILSADKYFMHIHINPLHKYDYFKGAVIL